MKRSAQLMTGLILFAAVAAAVPAIAGTLIHITTIEQLEKIGDNASYPLNASYVLDNDLDASATTTWHDNGAGGFYGFKPIGTSASPFTGAFDGGGHVIRNLYSNRPAQNYVGLFGDLWGSVSDLGLENVSIAGQSQVGALAGYNYGDIGGSYSTGAVTGSSSYAGGLVGRLNDGTITNCFSTCSVSCSGTCSEIGGLVGGNTSAGDIITSYSAGAVSCSGSCTNVRGMLGSSCGGGLCTCTSSYWDTETSQQAASAAGTPKTTAQMQSKVTFPDWNFTTVWGICDGRMYPFLKWMYGTAPTAIDDLYGMEKDTTLTVTLPNPLTNDSDPQCDPLSAILVSDARHGALTLQANGFFTYTPDPGFTGVDSFLYKAATSSDNSSEATVTIAVANSAPVAVADTYSVAENEILEIEAPGIMANDYDPDNDTLWADIVSWPAHGGLAIYSNGKIIYYPEPGFRGTDWFLYYVSDGVSESDWQMVSLEVGYNGKPVAAADAYTIARNTPLAVAAPGVLDNDTTAGANTLSAVLVSSAAHGVLALNPDGSFTYIPAGDFTGIDSFTYKTTDGLEESGDTTVTLTVTSHAITAAPDNYTTGKNETLQVGASDGLLYNDSDGLGHSLSAVLVTNPAHGSVYLNADGSFIYIPERRFKGQDSFTYKATDGAEDSALATVAITVGKQCPAVKLYGKTSAQVRLLRRFRDEVLNTSAAGGVVTALYYKLAPLAEKIIDASPFLQQAARQAVDMLLPPLQQRLER